MGVLKKIRAASVMETMVATVLIVVVFMVASLVLNNVFKNTMYANTDVVENRMQELHYLWLYEKISTPYKEEFRGWEITIEALQKQQLLELEAKHLKTHKEVTKILYHE